MPPKRSKVSKSEENVSNLHIAGQDGQLTGAFANDFPIRCMQNGLPPISVKLLIDPNNAANTSEAQQSTNSPSLNLPHFHIWYKPEVADDPLTKKIDNITIRGWKVTENVLTALQLSLQTMTVNELSFWHTGLDEQTFPLLIDTISQLQCRILDISGSRLTNIESTKKLLSHQDYSNLMTLNLRSCCLTDDVIIPLASSIKDDPPLHELDLSNNRLTSEGTRILMDSLRLNRNLMSLSLVGNHITDSGAVYISNILKEFTLNHEEIVLRRKLYSTIYQDQWTNFAASLCRRSSSRKSVGKDKQLTDGGKKPGPVALVKAASFIAKTKKGAEQKKKASIKNTPAVDEKTSPKPSPSHHQNQSQVTAASVPVCIHGPLAEGVEEKDDGTIVCLGNFSLVNISLAYNHITEVGVNALLSAVQYQIKKGPPLSYGVGLLNMNMKGNEFPSTYTMYETMQQLLEAKLTTTTNEKV